MRISRFFYLVKAICRGQLTWWGYKIKPISTFNPLTNLKLAIRNAWCLSVIKYKEQ